MAKSTTALLTGRIRKCKTNPSIAHIGLATHGRSIQIRGRPETMGLPQIAKTHVNPRLLALCQSSAGIFTEELGFIFDASATAPHLASKQIMAMLGFLCAVS
jgi:hypothetical protein